MNACVESVCPSPVRPGASKAPPVEQPCREQVRDRARAWLPDALANVIGVGNPAIPAIVHVHIESFYAAVERTENPRLRGKAVLVVGGRAVASASLEAQKRGVRAGMTVRDALNAYPNVIVVPGDYARYAKRAERVRRILEAYASSVEMTACGSFYLDFAGETLPYSGFEAKLRRMQAEVLGQTGLSASVGAGTSRMVAALAAREHRPCGLRIVTPGDEGAFLKPLPIEELRGIGRNHISALMRGGLKTFGELQRIPKGALVAALGAPVGHRMWELARGRGVGDFIEPAKVAAEVVRSAATA